MACKTASFSSEGLYFSCSVHPSLLLSLVFPRSLFPLAVSVQYWEKSHFKIYILSFFCAEFHIKHNLFNAAM